MFNTEQVRIILPNLKWFCRSTGNYLRRGNFLVHFDLVIISSVHLSFYYFEKSRKIGHLHYIITSVDLQVSALLSLKSEGMSWWLVTPVPAPGLAALSWRPLSPVVIMGCLQAGWPQLPPAPPQPFNSQWLMNCKITTSLWATQDSLPWILKENAKFLPWSCQDFMGRLSFFISFFTL